MRDIQGGGEGGREGERERERERDSDMTFKNCVPSAERGHPHGSEVKQCWY